jgi:hypothetical protein
VRRLLVVAAFGAALFGLVAPSGTAARTAATDYSTSVPAADADRDIGKTAVRPQPHDLKTLAKKRISDPGPPVPPILTVAPAVTPTFGAYAVPEQLAADLSPARRRVAAQPRAPPTIRS